MGQAGVGSRGVWVLGVCFVLGLGAVRPAWGDLPPFIPPDQRDVPATIELDWGPFAKVVSRRHLVAKGDTLRALATRYLGEAKRWKLIAQANSDVVKAPDRIQVGATLWIPPREEKPEAAAGKQVPKVPTAGLAGRYEAFWLQGSGRFGYKVSGRASPGELPERWQRGGRLLFMPYPGAAALIEALKKKEYPTHEQFPEPALLAPLYPNTIVKRDEATTRVVSRFRLDRVEGQLVQTVVERLRFDAKGKRVGGAGPKKIAQPAKKADSQEADPGPTVMGLDIQPYPDEPDPDEEEALGWPEMVGAIVALVGLLLIVGLAFFKSRRASESSTDPS